VTATIATEDGNTLEAMVESPDAPIGTVVLCHPHPLHGGTMRAPLLIALTQRALGAGYRVVRFNFRGVGTSTGEFGNGVAEVHDVAAVMAHAGQFPEPVMGICGWSFGAATALSWQAEAGSTVPYVGIAPPVDSPLMPPLPDPPALARGPRRFIIGARDQFVPVDDLEAYALAIGASVKVFAAADHFFIFRYDKLADEVVAGFGGLGGPESPVAGIG